MSSLPTADSLLAAVCERHPTFVGVAPPQMWQAHSAPAAGMVHGGTALHRWGMDQHSDTVTIAAQGPVDEHGRLLHEDDPAAQLALALANVAAVLHADGLEWRDLSRLRVQTTDLEQLLGVYDTLTEHLASVGATPETRVVEVPQLPLSGMTVTIDAVVEHSTRRNAMSSITHQSAPRFYELDFVHRPGAPAYDELRTPWNVAVDQRPAAVALPRTADEVAEVVRFAALAGLRVAPQGTGHGAAPFHGADLHDVVLVRTTAMSAVTVDPDRRVVRVESGALWQDVVEAAAVHGLAALHGSSPDVGVAGYSLGGGIGWYARKLGLATNSVTAVELVTAEGNLVRADAENHADLFWALRGGGGSFGVVTALELELFPIADAYAGMMIWDIEHAEPVLRQWAAWSTTAPDEITTSYRVMRFPPLPHLPEFLRGRSLVIVDGAALGDDAFGAAQVAGLRALHPEMDTFARVPAASLSRLHMDPEGPTPNVGGSAMLGHLDDAAIRSFLDAVGPGTSTSLLLAELRQLGGALGGPHPGGGALTHLEAEYVAFFVAIAPTAEMARQGSLDTDRALAALQPYATGGMFLNMAERRVDPSAGYKSAAWERLRHLRPQFDPTGLFVANHPVPGRS